MKKPHTKAEILVGLQAINAKHIAWHESVSASTGISHKAVGVHWPRPINFLGEHPGPVVVE